MFEAYPHVPLYLALLAVVFAGFIGYMMMYNRRQKNRLADLERHGMHAHSVDEGILLAQERAQQDAHRKTA